jgi:hypothetical protein
MTARETAMSQHDHSWAEDMSEVQAFCPDHNTEVAKAGIRCPGDEDVIVPAEHDAAQYALYQQAWKAEERLERLCDRAHGAAGDRKEGRGAATSGG